MPVRLSVAVESRLAAEIEATAYFLVSEGLTNVATHAGATTARVRMHPPDRRLDSSARSFHV